MRSSGALVLSLVVFAGCYAPNPPSGVACSPTGGCPSGQLCWLDGLCHTERPSEVPDARPPDPIDANIPVACSNPAIDTQIAPGTVAGEPYDDGETVEKTYTLTDDLLVVALNKAADPWEGTITGKTYTYDLADSCDAGSKTCVYIDAIPEGGGTARRHSATSGTLNVSVLQSPVIPADPDGCSAHNGDVTACDADPGACGYFHCSDRCQPDGTTLCNALCARGCGFTMTLENVTLVDETDAECQTHISELTL